MKKIYLDNGATSYPKAPGIENVISDYLLNCGSSVNRSTYSDAFSTENTIFETRELLCELFNFNKPENVIFTKNITESLNVVMKGLLKSGDHVIVSSMEHNAVMRPLTSLSKKGIEFSRVPCSRKGDLDPTIIEKYIKSNTKAIIMTHCSNVCGTVLPLEQVGEICKKHNLFFIVDAAQSAGVLPIDMEKFNIDCLCFTGHKSLLAAPGIGGFLINDRLNKEVCPLIEGGTGSLSDKEEQPSYMPDKFEGGTPNVIGILSLNTSLKFIMKTGLEAIHTHEMELCKVFMNGLKEIPGLRIVGHHDLEDMSQRLSTVSITLVDKDMGEFAHTLSRDYGISTRCGMHCAPSAHETLGTFPDGTIRFSIGYFNTKEDIEYALKTIQEMMK
ncbi:cysteine desulfurase family protein [Hathewaya proteolytica DSM 3090]|uniref:cysteine desulfurase n=1 Tax=Hathewaya proteolytica DSM 3090 TaxID=1121331 RepID=A0A1M6QLX1_9CLOT|nr:aminotransferase class V-fold PLP-dependent enzyme [Hathewaya proteolytica]SHK21254.1 cysteine desulfurase family protein [Hathewaya proteolytica DSM 3090]